MASFTWSKKWGSTKQIIEKEHSRAEDIARAVVKPGACCGYDGVYLEYQACKDDLDKWVVELNQKMDDYEAEVLIFECSQS